MARTASACSLVAPRVAKRVCPTPTTTGMRVGSATGAPMRQADVVGHVVELDRDPHPGADLVGGYAPDLPHHQYLLVELDEADGIGHERRERRERRRMHDGPRVHAPAAAAADPFGLEA